MSVSLRVDFHCHTIYSIDSLSRVESVLETARRRGIDRVVITDHNTTRGALEAQKLDPERVIVGEEVLTDRGELLAAYVREEIPAGLPWREAVARLRAQGAFISVSHPFDVNRHGWELSHLLELIPLVDAIEVFNSRCVQAGMNEQAQAFATQHGLAGTVGSDAHALYELGQATLRLPAFDSADGLRSVICRGQAETQLSMPWVHFSSTLARIYKQFS